MLDAAVSRAVAYREAGADCVYPIFLSNAEAIRSFVRRVAMPVNILAVREAPSVDELAELGVARVSYGPLVYRRVMGALRELLRDLPR